MTKTKENYIELLKKEMITTSELAKLMAMYENIKQSIVEKSNELEEIQKKIEQYPNFEHVGYDMEDIAYKSVRKIEMAINRAKNTRI